MSSRTSPHLAGTVGSVDPARGTAKNKWQTTIYDVDGKRKWVVITAESAGEAEEKALKLAQKSIVKRKKVFTSDEINSVIDDAVADNRIPPEKAERFKSLSPGDRRRQTKHFAEVVDGKLVYRPLSGVPWKLAFPMDKKDLVNLQARVRSKINSALKVGIGVGEELENELDYIKQAKNPDDLIKWEKRFNNKYAELAGDWKTVAGNYLQNSPESWANELIGTHARREFIKAGADRNEAGKMGRAYSNSLSSAEKVDWHNVLVPIKKYNDRVYKSALDNNNPDILKKIIAIHHIQPFGQGGSVRSASNIVGVEGGQHKMLPGSEHANIHDKLYNSYFENLKSQGVTVGEFAPPGSGGASFKMFGPEGELLNADEFVGGLKEGYTKPPDKFSIMNLLRNPVVKAGAKALPFLGYAAGAKGAVDYAKSDNPYLSAISGISAIPGVGDVLGIPLAAAELGGLVINRDKERMENRDNIFESPFQKRRRERITGLLNN